MFIRLVRFFRFPNPQNGTEQGMVEVVNLRELEAAFFRDEVVGLRRGRVRIFRRILFRIFHCICHHIFHRIRNH